MRTHLHTPTHLQQVDAPSRFLDPTLDILLLLPSHMPHKVLLELNELTGSASQHWLHSPTYEMVSYPFFLTAISQISVWCWRVHTP